MRVNDISAIEFTRVYKNGGQYLEQKMRYALTGEIVKADNRPSTKSADCLHYQIKSARATVCRGLDLASHLQADKATEYIYITKQERAYIMSKIEYAEFVGEFGTVTRESQKNGGHEKIRLGHETSKMLQWLAERV